MKNALLLAALLFAPAALSTDETSPRVPPNAPDDAIRAAHGTDMVDATYLGLGAAPLDIERAADLKIPEGAGLVVVDVAPDSPAAKAGLQKGDVLHHLNDQLLVNPGQLRVLIRAQKAGDTLTLTGMRKGEALKVAATLGTTKAPRITPGGEEPRVRIQPFPNRVPGPGVLNGGNGQGPKVHVLPLGPDGFGDMLDGVPQEMRAELEQMLKNMPQIGAAGQAQAGPGGTVAHSTMIFKDGENTFEVARGGADGDTLKITDKEGKSIYTGALPESDDTWNNVPESVRAKARKFSEGKGGIRLHIQSHGNGIELDAQTEVDPQEDGPVESR